MINILLNFVKSLKQSPWWQYWQIILFFCSLLLYSACGFIYFELPLNPDLTWGSAFWWAIVTMTTVGYGDFFPSSDAGRFLIGIPTMLLGIGLLGYILSMVASAMFEAKMKGLKGMKKIEDENHIVICRYTGLGRIMKLVNEIREDAATANSQIVLIDNLLDELPPELQNLKIKYVRGCPSRRNTMEQANVQSAKSIIIQASVDQPETSDNDNLKVALTLQDYTPETYTVVECLDPENEIFFTRAKCDSVVCIAALTDQMLIQEMQDPGIGAVISQLTSNEHGKQFYILPVPPNKNTYKAVKEHFNATSVDAILIGIKNAHKNTLLPADDFPISADDKVILIAAGRP